MCACDFNYTCPRCLGDPQHDDLAELYRDESPEQVFAQPDVPEFHA